MDKQTASEVHFHMPAGTGKCLNKIHMPPACMHDYTLCRNGHTYPRYQTVVQSCSVLSLASEERRALELTEGRLYLMDSMSTEGKKDRLPCDLSHIEQTVTRLTESQQQGQADNHFHLGICDNSPCR
mmetsp:Transcript_138051/g.257523  ORF Transcript_138051/g.257523 Transcript_138051/m.257523 type:complete len:127 (-) Transcript_138051:303-683(-)